MRIIVLVFLSLFSCCLLWAEQKQLGGIISSKITIEPDEIDDLVPYIIQVESGGNANAYNSRSGAIGLMQITPIVLKEYNNYLNSRNSSHFYIQDLYNKKLNKIIGTWYLRRLKDHYKCDTIEKILMAYNYGIGNCRKINFDLKKAPKETRSYVKKVMTLQAQNK